MKRAGDRGAYPNRRRFIRDGLGLSVVGLLAGCLPALLQVPFFLVMYRLFTAPDINGVANSLLGEPLLGVPLGQHLADATTDGTRLVFVGLFAALLASAWVTTARL